MSAAHYDRQVSFDRSAVAAAWGIAAIMVAGFALVSLLASV